MAEKSAEVLISEPDEPAIGGRVGVEPAGTDIERKLAEVLAEVISAERVSTADHFFTDLGANSLVMAQFCARVRKRPELPSVSMKDIYRHPTIQSLAAAVAGTTATATAVDSPAPTQVVPPTRKASARTLDYVLCGTLQLLVFLGYSTVTGLVAARGYEWVADGSGLVGTYLRSVLFGGIGFVVLCSFPIAAKWILIGRWKSREFPVWGLTYVRFWIVKALLHANPMHFFIGNPLYVLYLRALGARIGKGVTILSHSIPVCTDLLTVGAGTVIRKDSFFLCYRAHAGHIQTGRVTLGRDVFIGEKTVLDIDTSMGDGAQLGHSSALYRGQAVPDGERRHGSPAQPTQIDHVRVGPARCGTSRRFRFGLGTLLQLFLLYLPLTVGGVYMLFQAIPALGERADAGRAGLASSDFLIDALLMSSVLFFGFVVVGLVVVCAVPRLLNLFIKPDKVYPLYGFHYAAHRAIAGMTNLKFFTWLFGDSSYIVHYLRGLGYDLSRVEQTGSNFGTEVRHETPYLASVGSGTMVADGLSLLNAEFSSTSFRVSRASIGAHNFLGNNIAYPAGARTGDNCLLATKVMVPLDGELREGVGLLGSPCFEIPRSVERDSRFDHLRGGEELRRSLAAKNRYNARSMVFFLLVRWLHAFVLTALGLASICLYGELGHVVIAGYLALTLAFTALYFTLVERGVAAFRALRPRLCSIYDPYFWWHERLWKVPDEHLDLFNGTPFKNVIWRLLGVRLGSRVFDDGCYMTERTLTAVGDDCTLNIGSKIQCHSQEDGTFKSDRTTLGADCTLGVGTHVHYGVTLGDGVVLAPDSFLMKGEEVPPNAQWGGNPAAEMPVANHAGSTAM
ncbi:non-ribosomal peptide synthetase [Streptomyces bingchenggensis BCW-1]|uniref:Non-ribosomal peptide synthetase n=1 Tax=Streptomyces bingchenggensis (strain BCW-1) TaxID=749414 RepID=D7C874_STRBB|nr:MULTISPECIES: Pls/PosA family non-ribosomal peptide synthetase [Streptomyces]ADI04235.1 non-ribosomal peptide synthetase [Streptomyces bingchenggensis BCW-1]